MFKKWFDFTHRKRNQLFGDGEGEGDQGAGGMVVEEGQAAHEATGEGDSGGQSQGKQGVPYERFSQVNREKQALAQELAQYKKFGDVKSLAETIARSKELATGHRFTPSEIKALEEDLKQVPALKQVFDFVQNQSAEREEASKQFVNDAAGKVSTLVKELGFDFKTPEDKRLMEYEIQAVIAERIKQTPGWIGRWKRGDITVVTEAWNKVKGIYGWNRRQNNADIQAKKLQQGNKVGSDGAAPKDGKGGDGIPRDANGKIDERAVLSKAADRGFARLKAGEE